LREEAAMSTPLMRPRRKNPILLDARCRRSRRAADRVVALD
jgi:hypothetical protein